MGSPKAPTPADPKVTAGAQTANNIGTAIAQTELGNVNQVTPYGTLSYERTGSYEYTDPNTGDVHPIPTYTATTELSEGQQELKAATDQAELNLATLGAEQSDRLSGILGEQFDPQNLPDRADAGDFRNSDLERMGNAPAQQGTFDAGGDITKSYGANDFSADRQRVEDAMMGRLQTSIDQDQDRLDAQLAGQGIRRGSQAYKDAMDEASRSRSDARVSAILGAGQEQSRLTQMDAARASFENQAQQQQFNQNAGLAAFGNQAAQQDFQNAQAVTAQNNQASAQEFNQDTVQFDAQNNNRAAALEEAYAMRNQPINEITALMSGAQVNNPNFVNTTTGQIANTDFAGIQANYDAQLAANHQNDVSNRNAMFGAALGFGSNLLLSDERAKENIKKVGETPEGQNLYSYNYVGETKLEIGLLAQEEEKHNPDAVKTMAGGIKAVDYDKALNLGMKKAKS